MLAATVLFIALALTARLNWISGLNLTGRA